MSPVRKNPSSNPPSRHLEPYVENDEERSAIRARVRKNTPPLGLPHSPLDAPSVTQSSRLELKLSFAKLVLHDTPRSHERARLLRVAIIRRDETLLDELLGIGSPPDLDA